MFYIYDCFFAFVICTTRFKLVDFMFKTSRRHPKLRIIFIQVQQTPGFGGAQCLGRPCPTACNKKHETNDIVSHIPCLPRLSKTLLLQKYVPFINNPKKKMVHLPYVCFFFEGTKKGWQICEVVGRKGRSGPYFKRQEFFSCKAAGDLAGRILGITTS